MYLIRKSHFVYSVFLFAVFVYACKTPTSTSSSKGKGKNSNSINNEFKTESERLNFDFYFYNGVKEKSIDNIKEAAGNFKKCLEISPNNAAANYEFALCMIKLRDFNRAMDHAYIAARKDPENEWYQILLAQAYATNRKYKEASQVLEGLYKKNPDNIEILQSKIAVLQQIPDYNGMIKAYEKLEEKIGVNENITRDKIAIYNKQNNFSKSEAEVKKLIATDPLNVQFHLLLGDLYFENNMDEKAFEIYNQTLLKFPDNPYCYLRLSEYYYKKKDNAKYKDFILKSFNSPELPIEIKIEVIAPYYSMAGSEMSQEDKDFAMKLLENVIQTNPKDARGYAIKGDFLIKEEKYKEARSAYKASLEFDKSRYAVWNQILLINSQLNDYPAMADDAKAAIELFPNEPLPYLLNGIANSQLKKYEEAVSSLKKGVDFVVQNNAMLTQFYASMGDAYNSLKDFNKSDSAFEKALQVNPSDPYVLNNYSYFLSVRKDKLDKAEQMSKKANELVKNNSSYLDTYAWVLYAQGKYTEAKIWMEKALAVDNNKSAVLLEHYGDVLYKLEIKDQAVEYWKRAKQAGSGYSDFLDKKIETQKLIE